MMRMLPQIKRLINRILHIIGIGLYRYSSSNFPSMEFALKRISEMKNLEINTIIDVGASDGRWCKIAIKYFPDAFYFLIEANNFHKEGLDNFKRCHENSDYVLAAAGDTIGKIYFDASAPFAGLASHVPVESNCIIVPATTIDRQVEEKKLPPFFLLKLDTHGFEMPIFNGAQQTLKQTAIVIVEAYNFKQGKEDVRFHKLCSYMDEMGFRCVDIVDIMYRPIDKILWQMDIVFAKKNRKELLLEDYQ